MVNVGIFTTQLLGYLYSYGQMWRLVLGAGGAIGLLIGNSACSVPPRARKWLASSGKIKQGSEILQRIRGREDDIEEEVQSWSLSGAPDLNPGAKVCQAFETKANNNRRGAKAVTGQRRRQTPQISASGLHWRNTISMLGWSRCSKTRVTEKPFLSSNAYGHGCPAAYWYVRSDGRSILRLQLACRD